MNTPITPARSYLFVWGGLLLLLLLTWGCAQFDLGPWNVVVALTIAVTKMLLVILFFMQVRYSSRLTWVFVAAGFIWLLIMLDLTLSDYLTRGTVR
jgi:cytochrome c oxidase subunit 4